jgi:hypothetical protein
VCIIVKEVPKLHFFKVISISVFFLFIFSFTFSPHLGPHREMAVDVPETFIARNKTPPRYPPPRTQVNEASSIAMPQVAKYTNGGVSLELEPLDTFGRKKQLSSSLEMGNDYNTNKKQLIKAPSSLGSVSDSNVLAFDSMSYNTKSRGSLSTRSSSSGDLGPPEYDLGPHRELPVDVPDSFIEVVKAPPRYPPPKMHGSKQTVSGKESNSSQDSLEMKRPQPQTPARNEVFFFASSFMHI